MADDNVIMIPGVSSDGNTGTIRYQVETITNNCLYTTPAVEVRGILWKCSAILKAPFIYRGNGVLCVYLNGPKNDSVMWSIDVSAQCTVFNKDDSKNIVREFKGTYDSRTNGAVGFESLLLVEKENKEQGFLNYDGKISFELRFTLSNVMGIRRTPGFDFTDSSDPRNDAILIIDGKKVYANKGVLSTHSPVFNAMYFGYFSEKEKHEIELKDVEYKEFIEALNIIYPTGLKLTDENALRLLPVADRFQFEMLLNQIEQLLIKSTKLTRVEKLKISGEYRLVELQGYCLDDLSSYAVEDLKKSEDYEEFSGETKLAMDEMVERKKKR